MKTFNPLYAGLQIALLLSLVSACQTTAPRGIPDAGAVDSATPDATTDAMAADADARDDRCESNFDCSGGAMCVDGRCQSAGGDDCTSLFDCPEGQVCTDGRCGPPMGAPPMGGPDTTDPPPGSTCCDGIPCEGDLYCNEACECADPTVCDPPCADPLVCDFGYCTHPCTLDGCEGDLICTETGCIEPRCTYEECTSRALNLACDPYDRGCYDPCDEPGIREMCAGLGAVCELGACIDASCSSVGSTCGFVEDCCGTFYCQSAADPEPECPSACGDPEEAPPEEFCACDVMGFCIDQRWSAGYMSGGGALPPPDSGSADGGVPFPAP